ncbi:MAG TPA: AFG1/ZapE family ATPase, partial [Glaciihabitans sp.]|nr:AFG1/ZapE family ATPase [Glaciihabitans sp.]
IRIDGLDYRRRDLEGHAVSLSEDAFDADLAATTQSITVDDFGALLAHLSQVHPSRYVRLIEGVDAVALRDVRPFTHQSDALRFVAFVDRLYDAQVKVIATGTPLDAVFAEDMLAGGYRKKYLRAISRIVALTSGTRTQAA